MIDPIFVDFFSTDRPLTLGILCYIVYLLHKTDLKQTKAIKWLRASLASIASRTDNLEKFNQRKFPDEWRQPPHLPHIPLNDDFSLDDDDLDE